jgi:membrane-associated phospholipid phosphatase
MRPNRARPEDGPVSKSPELLASTGPQVQSAGQLRRLERLLPNGWGDFLCQVAIWLGFALGYQVARGLSDRGPAEAFRNARRLLRLEERLGGLPELAVERHVLASGSALVHIVDWTYWLAQFAVVGAALLWVYLRHNAGYPRLRDTIIIANTLGLVGYVALPVAPPRLLPERGFVDTLGQSEVLNHGSGIVHVLANPYAAMPSLHAADAFIVGVALAAAFRSRWLKALFLLWPLWVCFSLLATANHYWLDLAAGAALAVLGAALTGGRGRALKRPVVRRAGELG